MQSERGLTGPERSVIEALDKAAGQHQHLSTHDTLCRAMGVFNNLCHTVPGKLQESLAPWADAAKELRRQAQKLATLGSNDCTHIMHRVDLHQQAAETFKRSGESSCMPDMPVVSVHCLAHAGTALAEFAPAEFVIKCC